MGWLTVFPPEPIIVSILKVVAGTAEVGIFVGGWPIGIGIGDTTGDIFEVIGEFTDSTLVTLDNGDEEDGPTFGMEEFGNKEEEIIEDFRDGLEIIMAEGLKRREGE